MAKNKLTDLNDHLFMQLERLNDEDLKDDALVNEVKRAKAISQVASQVVKNAEITLRAVQLVQSGNARLTAIPATFGLEKKSE